LPTAVDFSTLSMKYDPARGAEAGKKQSLTLRQRQEVQGTLRGGIDAAVARCDKRQLDDDPIAECPAWQKMLADER